MQLASSQPSVIAPARAWSIGLWSVQLALAAVYGVTGSSKALMPVDELVKMGMLWAQEAPVWLIRFIGGAELAGAVGILLPALLRIQPGLTPLAALGFSAIQMLAMAVHAARAEWHVLPVNAILLALSLFVFWGRTRKVVIA